MKNRICSATVHELKIHPKSEKVPAPMLAGKVHGDLLLLSLQVTLSYNQKVEISKGEEPHEE